MSTVSCRLMMLDHRSWVAQTVSCWQCCAWKHRSQTEKLPQTAQFLFHESKTGTESDKLEMWMPKR